MVGNINIKTESEIISNYIKTEDVTANFGYKQELHRGLNLKDLIIYGLIIMLPIAPVEVYGMVAKESFGMVPLVYLIGIIAMVFTAWSYSQMSKEFPIAGSAYSFVQRGLNPHIGFVTGWLIMADYLVIPALLTSFSAIWLNNIFPFIPKIVIILLFIAVNTFVTARGITLTATVNRIFLFVELTVIAFFIGFAIKYVFIDGQGTAGFSLSPFFQPDTIDFSFIASATSIAVLGFIGFDAISTLSEEVKNPGKTVGKATVASLIIIGLLFISQSYLAALAHPQYKNLDPDMAFFDIAREVGGDFLYYFFILVAVAAVGIANTLAVQSAISRIIFSMSRDKLLPFSNLLGKVHPTYKTPFNASIFVGLVSVVVALFVSVDTIISLVNFGALSTYMILNLTVLVYFYIKKKQRNRKDFFNYFLLPLTGFLIIAYVWSGFDKITFVVGSCWLLLGIILGAVKSKGYKEVPPVLRDV